MNYRPLGQSELNVSEIGFGCMSLNPNQSNIEILQKAFEQGINYFDTADLYDKGRNEEIVGEVLKEVRDKVIIATKVGNEWNPDGKSWRWNPTKEYIMKAVDRSLQRLRTDYIDLYQLHGGTIGDPIDETIEAFELLKEQGKIREYGISSIRPNVIREYVTRSNIVSVMMQYSLLDRRPEEQVLGLLENKGISVVCRGVLARGMLLDKPVGDYLGYDKTEVRRLKTKLDKPENPMGEVLGYTLSSKAVSSNVVGFRTVLQLEEVLGAYDLGWKNLEGFRSLLEPNKYGAHRI